MRKPDIGPVPTSNGLLDRVGAFLEEAKGRRGGATAEQAESVEKVELEDDYEGQHVELDLACGIFDLIDDEAVRKAEIACVGQQLESKREPVSEPQLVQEVPNEEVEIETD